MLQIAKYFNNSEENIQPSQYFTLVGYSQELILLQSINMRAEIITLLYLSSCMEPGNLLIDKECVWYPDLPDIISSNHQLSNLGLNKI